jgi:hypothetical protein
VNKPPAALNYFRWRNCGAVAGLNGAGLVLQNNGGDNLAINGAGSFTFAASMPPGQRLQRHGRDGSRAILSKRAASALAAVRRALHLPRRGEAAGGQGDVII